MNRKENEMKIRCDKAELHAACMTAARASASKSPITVLEGLKLEAIGNQVRITGYDLRKGIHTSIESEVDEGGKVVVNCRLFCEMLRKLPDGMVSISCDDKLNMVVKCGRTQFNIIGQDAEEYPELPAVDPEKSIRLSQSILRNMIGRTIFAIADNDVRPIYTGVLFEIEDGQLTLVAVDGFRLARRTETIEGEIENCSFVVPGYSLNDLEKILVDDNEKSVLISVGSKHISFELDNTVLVSRRLEGDFLNYKKSVPEDFRYTVRVNKSEMLETIDRVSLIISEKNTNPVRMTFGDNKINCLCITPIGKAEDTCSCEGSGEDMLIGFNDRYFSEALKACEDAELNLCLNSSTSPCIIKSTEDKNNYTYMILPVRLRAGD